MIRFIHFVDDISTWVGKAFSWAVVLLTIGVCYEVFMRYVLRQPTAWAYDASYMLYGAMFIMAGAYALAHNAHVRGDVLFRFWPLRVQGTIELTLYVIFFFPAVLGLIYAGYGFAKLAWMVNEHSSFSPAGPPLYHFKSLIPIAGVFLFIQGIAEVCRCIICIRDGYWPPREKEVADIVEIFAEEHHLRDGPER